MPSDSVPVSVGSHSPSCNKPKALPCAAGGRSSSVCTHSTDRVRSGHEIFSYRWLCLGASSTSMSGFFSSQQGVRRPQCRKERLQLHAGFFCEVSVLHTRVQGCSSLVRGKTTGNRRGFVEASREEDLAEQGLGGERTGKPRDSSGHQPQARGQQAGTSASAAARGRCVL